MTFFDRRFDPLTRLYTRSTNALATQVEQARSIEPHDPIDTIDMRDDLLYKIAVVICSLSVVGVIGIVILELWVRK